MKFFEAAGQSALMNRYPHMQTCIQSGFCIPYKEATPQRKLKPCSCWWLEWTGGYLRSGIGQNIPLFGLDLCHTTEKCIWMLKSGIEPDQYHFLPQITQEVVLISTQEVGNKSTTKLMCHQYHFSCVIKICNMEYQNPTLKQPQNGILQRIGYQTNVLVTRPEWIVPIKLRIDSFQAAGLTQYRKLVLLLWSSLLTRTLHWPPPVNKTGSEITLK